jgi:hypothetical protein
MVSGGVPVHKIQEQGNVSDNSQTDGEHMCILSIVLHAVLSNTHNSRVIVENVACNVRVLVVCE